MALSGPAGAVMEDCRDAAKRGRQAGFDDMGRVVRVAKGCTMVRTSAATLMSAAREMYLLAAGHNWCGNLRHAAPTMPNGLSCQVLDS